VQTGPITRDAFTVAFQRPVGGFAWLFAIEGLKLASGKETECDTNGTAVLFEFRGRISDAILISARCFDFARDDERGAEIGLES